MRVTCLETYLASSATAMWLANTMCFNISQPYWHLVCLGNTERVLISFLIVNCQLALKKIFSVNQFLCTSLILKHKHVFIRFLHLYIFLVSSILCSSRWYVCDIVTFTFSSLKYSSVSNSCESFCVWSDWWGLHYMFFTGVSSGYSVCIQQPK